MLRLRDIMTTDVFAVETTTTLRDVAELLAERHVGGVPVVEGGVLAGVVSATDVLAFAAATPPEPPPAPEEEDAGGAEGWERPEWEDDDDPAARYFAERWSTASDDGDERSVDERFEEPAPRDVLAAHTAGEIMTRDVLTLPPTADVATAARRMREADVHRLLVVEGNALVGIVTTTDIARAVADGRVGRRTFVFGAPRGGRR